MHHVGIFIQDIDTTVQNGDALDVFILGVGWIDKGMPAPIDGGQENVCFEKGKEDIGHGKGPTNKVSH